MSELTPVRCGCGGEAVLETDHDTIQPVAPIDWKRVRCNKCNIRTTWRRSEALAIEAWNRAMGAKDINVPNKERNKGKWQRRKGSDCWECSQCHAVLESDDIVRHNYYYCYHCGADMMNKSGYMDIEEVHYE